MTFKLPLLCAFTASLALVAACGASRVRTHQTTYPSGSPRWQTQLVDGVPDGESITWHVNGQMASRGTYRAGLRDGEFVFWDDQGLLVRRERYAAGRFVGGHDVRAGVRMVGPVAPAARATVTRSAPPALDRYTELRIGTGFVASNSAREVSSMDGTESAPGMALGLSLLIRSGNLVFGASGTASSGLWAESHGYLGAVVGVAATDTGAHLEFLAEGGIHTVSGLGNDLFTRAMTRDQVELPYVGAQVRLSLDPGAPNHFVVDISVAGRVDLGRERRQVVTETCFIGCSTRTESWEVGGQSLGVTLGLGYRFD